MAATHFRPSFPTTQITAVSPAQAASMQTVFVTTAGGTSQPLVAVAVFFYDAPVPGCDGGGAHLRPHRRGAPPSPSPGPASREPAKCTSEPWPPPASPWSSDSEITAVAPAEATGTRAVTVTTAGGTNTPVAGGQFTFKGATPTVTAVAPTSGPTSGGTTVTITGTGFTGATQVAFGPVAATRFTVVSDHPDHRCFAGPVTGHPVLSS